MKSQALNHRPDPLLMNEKDAAAYLGFSVETLQAWRSRRVTSAPPFIRIGAGTRPRIRYARMDLDVWVSDQSRVHAEKGQ